MPARMPSAILHLLLALWSAQTFGATPPEWEAGREAWARGDYAAALALFEQARDAGLDTAAVHYNIGVSEFRLGRFEAARASFADLASRFPAMAALAEYNLGLVARRLGDTPAATRHFLDAYRLADDDTTLRILASRRLAELDLEAPPGAGWNGAAGFRAGYDDNVALRDEAGLPAGSSPGSPAFDLFGTISSPSPGARGFLVEAMGYLVRYSDASEFDQTELAAGAWYRRRGDAWRWRAGVRGSTGFLGGERFDRKLGVEASASRALGARGRAEVSLRYDDVSATGTGFAGIRGDRLQAEARYTWTSGGHRLAAEYRFETNDRAQPGVSPDRHGFGVDYRYRASSGLGYETGIAYRSSSYDDLAMPREENLVGFRAALTWRPSRDWLLLLEAAASSNSSDDPVYEYRRNVVTLGAMRLF
jgi:hypothetical protein